MSEQGAGPPDKPKTALLTGATGFIGSHLARRLAQTGWRVHALIRKTSDTRQLTAGGNQKIYCHVHDGSGTQLIDIVGDVRPLMAFHLAAVGSGQHAPQDVRPLIESNIVLGAQLLEALAVHQIPFLINTSTYWQHYLDRDYNPVDLYAATKKAFEDILKYAVESSPLQAISLVLFDTYGPGDPRGKLFYQLTRAARSGATLSMSAGEQLIDLVYIDDVLDAYERAAQLLIAGEVAGGHSRFAVSAGSRLSLKQLVELFCEITEQQIDIHWGGRAYRPREVMRPWTQGESLPGWRPRVSLREGMSRIVAGNYDKKKKNS